MESIRQIYKIGLGPSSSHTMGPRKAAGLFLEKTPGAAKRKITLYGSLAATGRGHLTDKAILDVLTPDAPAAIVWQPDVFLPFHPNGMKFTAIDNNGSIIKEETYYSIGGGDIVREGESRQPADVIYDMTTIKDILEWCDSTGLSYWEYVPERSLECNERSCGTWH